MYSLLFLSGIALLLSLALTPLCRFWFTRLGLVDRPDQNRKLHGRPVPRVGGLPLAAAYVGSFGLLLVTPLSGGVLLSQYLPSVLQLLPAACVVFLTGLCDDLWNLRPWQKFLGQFLAAGLAWMGGVQIFAITGWTVPGWLSMPLTLLWLVGCANAFNLIDGVDGLAAGIGFFATATMLAAALLKDSFPLALATAPLAGALLAFLRYNFCPASIFLGDSGSLLIGFLLGCYGALWSQKAATVLGMTAPLMVLAIPILDVFLSICRRFLGGRPIFAADRGHIHHRLLDRGLSPRRVALVLYALCGGGAVLSLLTSLLDNQYSGLFLVAFCLGLWFGIRNLRYIEFDAVGRVVWGGILRRLLVEQILLGHLRESLRAARTPLECWQAIRDTARRFGVGRLHLCLAGETFAEPEIAQAVCTLRIPIRRGEWVNCWFRSEHISPTLGLAMFSRVVSEELRARAGQLMPSLQVDPQIDSLVRNLQRLETTPPRQAPSDLREPLAGCSGAD